MTSVKTMAVVLMLTGCGQMSWQTIAATDAAGALAWRSANEPWGTGGRSVVRRVSGSWEQLEMCAPYAKSNASTDNRNVAIGFRRQEVWALCGTSEAEGQVLVRHDGSGNAAVIEAPIDGTLSFVRLGNGELAMIGAREMWSWSGTAWVSISVHPLAGKGGILSAAGVSIDEVYLVTDGLQQLPPLIWWNGTRWQNMLGETSHALEVRFGKVWMGLSYLDSGFINPLEFKGKAALIEKQLVMTSLLSEKRALATRFQNTEYWSIGVDDAQPAMMGSAPTVAGGSQAPDVTVYDVYGNAGTIMSRGDNGSGIGNVFGIDDNTVAIVSVIGGGIAGGGKASYSLVEGRR